MYKEILKPFLDKSFIVITAPIIIPLIIVISILIALFDGFPIFFIQERPGKNLKIFRLIKFRTMLPENVSVHTESITKLGSVLRRTSLDEIPSFFNVLVGDMSLIGPRPLLKEYINSYDQNQIKRHNVAPGLTGLAQIMGRNKVSWKERFNYDLDYVNEINLALDIKIFVKTLFLLFNKDIINQDNNTTMKRFDEE